MNTKELEILDEMCESSAADHYSMGKLSRGIAAVVSDYGYLGEIMSFENMHKLCYVYQDYYKTDNKKKLIYICDASLRHLGFHVNFNWWSNFWTNNANKPYYSLGIDPSFMAVDRECQDFVNTYMSNIPDINQYYHYLPHKQFESKYLAIITEKEDDSRKFAYVNLSLFIHYSKVPSLCTAEETELFNKSILHTRGKFILLAKSATIEEVETILNGNYTCHTEQDCSYGC